MSIGFTAKLDDSKDETIIVDINTFERLSQIYSVHDLTEQGKINRLIDENSEMFISNQLKQIKIEDLEEEIKDKKEEFKALFIECRKTTSEMLFYSHLSKLLGFFLFICVTLLSIISLNAGH